MAAVFDGEWQLMKATPFERVWIMDSGGDQLVVKRETLTHSMTAEANAQAYNDSEGQRWGDGQVFARVPLDIYFNKVEPMKQAGDWAGLRRFYNDSDNQWLRTRKGRI